MDVLGGAPGRRRTEAPTPARSLEGGGTVRLPVVAAESRRHAPLTERCTADGIWQVGLDDIDHSAQRIASVQDACRTTNDLDAGCCRGLDAREMVVAPLIVLQPLPVIHHEHARIRQAADHRFPGGRAAAVGPYTGNVGQRITQRIGAEFEQLVGSSDSHRLR